MTEGSLNTIKKLICGNAISLQVPLANNLGQTRFPVWRGSAKVPQKSHPREPEIPNSIGY